MTLLSYIVIIMTIDARLQLLPFVPPVPGAASTVMLRDLGPESVRVEWTNSTLPQDDGGSPLLKVRITYMEAGQEAWSEMAVEVPVDDQYVVVTGLRPRTIYRLRMQVRNQQGELEWWCVCGSLQTQRSQRWSNMSKLIAT